jgi:hypothetical protein
LYLDSWSKMVHAKIWFYQNYWNSKGKRSSDMEMQRPAPLPTGSPYNLFVKLRELWEWMGNYQWLCVNKVSGTVLKQGGT